MLNVLRASLIELPAWMLVALGFYFAFRVLKFPDLTVDASFVTGTVATAMAATNFSSSALGLVLAILFGCLAGTATWLVYLTNPRPAYKLLAGVLVMFASYSVNYRLLNHAVESCFTMQRTEMNRLAEFEASTYASGFKPLSLSIGLALVLVLILCLRALMATHFGLVLRSVGSRPSLVMSNGPRYAGNWRRSGLSRFNRVNMSLWFGLALSNAIVGTGGWFYASTNATCSINIFGTVIHALAAIIIGETICGVVPGVRDRRTSIWVLVITPLGGAIVYQIVKAFVAWVMVDLSVGIDGSNVSYNSQDQNFLFVILLLVLILLSKAISQWAHATDYQETDEELV